MTEVSEKTVSEVLKELSKMDTSNVKITITTTEGRKITVNNAEEAKKILKNEPTGGAK